MSNSLDEARWKASRTAGRAVYEHATGNRNTQTPHQRAVQEIAELGGTLDPQTGLLTSGSSGAAREYFSQLYRDTDAGLRDSVFRNKYTGGK